MICILKSIPAIGAPLVDAMCLSTDDFPTNVANGSKLEVLTVDDSGSVTTGTVDEYRFVGEWVKIVAPAAPAGET